MKNKFLLLLTLVMCIPSVAEAVTPSGMTVDLCILTVTKVQENLDNNVSTDDLIVNIDNFSKQFSDNASSAITNLVAQYLPQIVHYLEDSKLSPEDTCTSLGISR